MKRLTAVGIAAVSMLVLATGCSEQKGLTALADIETATMTELSTAADDAERKTVAVQAIAKMNNAVREVTIPFDMGAKFAESFKPNAVNVAEVNTNMEGVINIPFTQTKYDILSDNPEYLTMTLKDANGGPITAVPLTLVGGEAIKEGGSGNLSATVPVKDLAKTAKAYISTKYDK